MASTRTVVGVLVVIGVVGAVLATGALTSIDGGDGDQAGPQAMSAAGGADPGEQATGPQVVDAEYPEQVPEDEHLQVTVSLLPETDQPVTRTVSLSLDTDGDGELDTVLAESERTLSEEGPTEVTLTVPRAQLEPGDYQYGVVVGDRSTVVGSTVVMARANFGVAANGSSAVAGTNATVPVTVTNLGDMAGKRSVELAFDAGRNGSFVPVSTASPELEAGEERTLSLSLPMDALAPGTYTYRVQTEAEADTGQVRLLEPARFTVTHAGGTTNVTRGTNATVTATVENTGEVAGTAVVELAGPENATGAESLALDAGEGETVNFTVPTADRPRGVYDYTVAADGNGTTADVRVREPVFAVSDLRGNETLIVGDPMVFAANVTNVGGAAGNATVEFRLDVDDDDIPESDDITRNVTLAPGEGTAVRFDVPYMEDPDPLNQVEDLPTGTYIYGIYTADGNQTGVFDARSRATTTNVFRGGGGGGSDGDEAGTGDGFERASLDEVAQAKYGYFYEEISGETQGQLEEIHARQPFAGDLGVTDVLTREEIARQEYGLDVEVGDDFEFSSIEIELQQQIEADFDAQFTSDTGDRVQSWEELARERFGQSFGNLTESQQEEVREHYREQFDS